MSHDSVFSSPKASGGVHEQIESFLETVMRGLMRSHDQQAGEQVDKLGRPVYLPSVTLWMAVLVAILRGLKSQRAIWRLIAAGGWWKQPSYDIGDQAVYKRLEQEGWRPLAQVFERVSQLIAHWLQPALQAYHQRHAPLAPFAKQVVALDEMHLDPPRPRQGHVPRPVRADDCQRNPSGHRRQSAWPAPKDHHLLRPRPPRGRP